MGTRISIGDYNYEAIDFNVSESSSPLSAGDTSGSVGSLSFAFPTPTTDTTYPTEKFTNLFTNPSFETASGTVEVRRNLAPQPVSSNFTGTVVARGTGAWMTDDPTGEYLRMTCDVDGAMYLDATPVEVRAAVTAGQTYTLSIDARIVSGTAILRGYWYDAGGTLLGKTADVSTTAQNQWTRLSVTEVAPASAATVGFYSLRMSVVGETLDTRRALIEESATAGTFFDGTTPPKVRRNTYPYPRGTVSKSAYVSVSPNPVTITASASGGARLTYDGPEVTNVMGLRFTNVSAPEGVTTTVSLEVLVPAENGWAGDGYWIFRDDPNNDSTAATLVTQNAAYVPGEPTRVSATFTPNAGRTVTSIYYVPNTAPSPGQWWEIDKILVEEGTAVLPYMDGSTSPTQGYMPAWEGTADASPSYLYDGDFTQAWVGTADASESVLTGIGIAQGDGAGTIYNAIASAHWSKTGARSIRKRAVDYDSDIASYATDLNTKVMTLLATARRAVARAAGGTDDRLGFRLYGSATVEQYATIPREAGEHDVRLTLTVPADTTNAVLRFSRTYGTDDLWLDDILLVEGDYSDIYFDGSTSGSQWNGTPDASTSTRTIPGNDSILKYGASWLRDQEIRLSDSRYGYTLGRVESASTSDGVVNVTGVSRLDKLNVYGVEAQPYVGTLGGAFEYYLSLANITTDLFVDESVASRPVTLRGFTGELWFNLKQLAMAQECDISLVSGIVLLRPIRTRVAEVGKQLTATSSAGGGPLAQTVEVYWYQTQEITGGLVYPPGGWTPEVEVLNVNAGETAEYQLELSASVSSIDQPVMGTSVGEDYDSSSVYTIVADDGFPVPVDQWDAQGGSLAVSINPDTTTLTVTLTGARNVPVVTGGYSKAFSVALASDVTGSRYSTLRIVGNGVSYNRTKKVFRTGVPASQTAQEVGETIDNIFLTDLNLLYHAGSRAASNYSGLVPTLSGTVTAINRRGDTGSAEYPTYDEIEASLSAELGSGFTYADEATYYTTTLGLQDYVSIKDYWFDTVQSDFANQAFGNVNGARFKDPISKRWYRIREGTLSPRDISLTAEDDLTMEDVQLTLTGQTYAEVQTTRNVLSYNQERMAGLIG